MCTISHQLILVVLGVVFLVLHEGIPILIKSWHQKIKEFIENLEKNDCQEDSLQQAELIKKRED